MLPPQQLPLARLIGEQARSLTEAARVRSSPAADDEPGRQYPDPDETPPADEPHAEYDPLPTG